MKKLFLIRMLKPFLFLLTTFLFSTQAYALTAEEEFNLKEKCGKSAGEFFKTHYHGPFEQSVPKEGFHAKTSYTSHYNKKLNVCFLLYLDQRIKKGIFSAYELYDVIETKEYGTFIYSTEKNVIMCRTYKDGSKENEHDCSSETEWKSFIKSYMEE